MNDYKRDGESLAEHTKVASTPEFEALVSTLSLPYRVQYLIGITSHPDFKANHPYISEQESDRIWREGAEQYNQLLLNPATAWESIRQWQSTHPKEVYALESMGVITQGAFIFMDEEFGRMTGNKVRSLLPQRIDFDGSIRTGMRFNPDHTSLIWGGGTFDLLSKMIQYMPEEEIPEDLSILEDEKLSYGYEYYYESVTHLVGIVLHEAVHMRYPRVLHERISESEAGDPVFDPVSTNAEEVLADTVLLKHFEETCKWIFGLNDPERPESIVKDTIIKLSIKRILFQRFIPHLERYISRFRVAIGKDSENLSDSEIVSKACRLRLPEITEEELKSLVDNYERWFEECQQYRTQGGKPKL